MHSDGIDRKRKKRRIRTMNAVNVVELIIVVWSFSAVCQDSDDDFIVSCDDVTGSVGKEVTLTCSVSLKITECCITKYKFQYPEIYKDSICQDVSVNSCEQRNSFTCRYTPSTAMKEQFRFFVQTTCGMKPSKFTVNITEPIVREIVTEAPGKKEEPVWDISETNEQKKPEGRGFKIAVIAAVISSFIIIIMPIIYRLTQKYTNRNRTLLSVRQEEDDGSHPENFVIAVLN